MCLLVFAKTIVFTYIIVGQYNSNMTVWREGLIKGLTLSQMLSANTTALLGLIITFERQCSYLNVNKPPIQRTMPDSECFPCCIIQIQTNKAHVYPLQHLSSPLHRQYNTIQQCINVMCARHSEILYESPDLVPFPKSGPPGAPTRRVSTILFSSLLSWPTLCPWSTPHSQP